MKNNTLYILWGWVTSVVFTPVIFLLLLGILPGFHIPDMIGFLLKIYILPCTLTYSVVNLIALFIISSNIQKTCSKVWDAKIRFTLAVIAITAIITMAIRKLNMLDNLDVADSYILPVSYLMVAISTLWFFKFKL